MRTSRSTAAILFRLAPAIVAAIATLVAAFLLWFAYDRLYRTFADAQEIAVLRTTVAVEDIDQSRFTAITERARERAALPALPAATVPDIFSAPDAAPGSQPPATSRPLR